MVVMFLLNYYKSKTMPFNIFKEHDVTYLKLNTIYLIMHLLKSYLKRQLITLRNKKQTFKAVHVPFISININIKMNVVLYQDQEST